jgi:hypothetical protein
MRETTSCATVTRSAAPHVCAVCACARVFVFTTRALPARAPAADTLACRRLASALFSTSRNCIMGYSARSE